MTTRIRTTHPYGFRCGEWAALRGTALLPVVPGEPDRTCYLVEFDDEVTDFWPIDDVAHGYEFA